MHLNGVFTSIFSVNDCLEILFQESTDEIKETKPNGYYEDDEGK